MPAPRRRHSWLVRLVALLAAATGCGRDVAPQPSTANAPVDEAALETPTPGDAPTGGSPEDTLERMRSEFAATPANPKDPEWVKAKLDHMVELDQFVRANRLSPFSQVDEPNTRDLKELIALHGWFTIRKFGAQADHQAWLLVQHADLDPVFQQEMLALLEPLVKTGDTDPANFAYLYDRVHSAEGRCCQRYGTQGMCRGSGLWEPLPLEVPDEVDALRAAVGLGTLEENRERLSARCL